MQLTTTGTESVGLIHLAKEKEQWKMFVNTVMDLLVP
jgi:hypothetical protein